MESKRIGKKKLRENEFKYIFSLDFVEKSDEEKEAFFEENKIEDAEDRKIFLDLEMIFLLNKKNIDEMIQRNIKKTWSINRLHKVTLALLRLAILEIVYFNTPFKLAINEAVELAKKYSDQKEASFLNGVLSGVLKEIEEKNSSESN